MYFLPLSTYMAWSIKPKHWPSHIFHQLDYSVEERIYETQTTVKLCNRTHQHGKTVDRKSTITTLIVTAAAANYDTQIGEYYHCSDSSLTTIPVDIPSGTKILRLTSNGISNFASFPELPLLEVIHLETNYLTAFPDLRNVSTTLRYLRLDRNLINWISEDRLSGLNSLEALILSNNRLSALPDVEMKHLEALIIDGNQLMANLAVLPRLGRTITNLKLGHPTMDPVSLVSLEAIPQLKTLTMERSGLRELPPVIEANPMLRKLYIRGNYIQE
ncbi:hypothetical protein LSH36_937g00011 [Paralvinella palmiformis]|uniref:Uncharacterized protein n=1 Tax=Paralvinella palmiformis TaxID=53620 RepID=A0AAD9MSK0_9ANNE|nr:hypothetical protein LSH36_937g00011 [Paralvinella palmiformis]